VPPDIMRDDGSPGDAPPTGVEITRARSAELFVQFRDDSTSAAARTVARDALVHHGLLKECSEEASSANP